MRSLFFILIFAVLGWSACRTLSSSTGSCYDLNVETRDGCNWPSGSTVNCGAGGVLSLSDYYGGNKSCVITSCTYDGCRRNFTYVSCSTVTESDSVKCLNAGNQWIDGSCCDAKCLCLKEGHQWNESTQSCESCNDHVDVPDKCVEVWKNGYTTDVDGNPGGGGYWAIETYECYYDSCAMSLNCQGPKNSFPAGNLTCDDFQDTTLNKKCLGVVGHRCTIQCPNNTTINCDCDGSCVVAQTSKGCQCPINSSSSTPSSSSSGDGSSSSPLEELDGVELLEFIGH